VNGRSSWRRRLAPAGLLLAAPGTAGAHTVISGVGDYFSGVLHPLTTPAHVLVLLSLGLLVGQHTPFKLKTALAVFIPVSAAALACTATGLIATVYPPLIISLALVTALLVAVGKPPPALVLGVLSGLAGAALGLDSAVETGTGLTVLKTLLGTWTGLIIAVADVAYYSSRFTRRQWQQIGLRVAGSWITAASFMTLAFALRR